MRRDREDAARRIVQADEKLTAFLELECQRLRPFSSFDRLKATRVLNCHISSISADFHGIARTPREYVSPAFDLVSFTRFERDFVEIDRFNF